MLHFSTHIPYFANLNSCHPLWILQGENGDFASVNEVGGVNTWEINSNFICASGKLISAGQEFLENFMFGS